MLWISGSLILLVWLIATLVLHKGGIVHALFFTAIALFLIQLAQDRRTAEYHRNQRDE